MKIKNLLLLMGFCFALAGCTGFLGNAPKGNGEGVAGWKPPIAGFDNTRILCHFQQKSITVYDVRCDAVVIAPDGKSEMAEGKEPGVDLSFANGVVLEGSEILSQSCSVAANGLMQNCEINLAQSTSMTQVKFDLKITKVATTENRIESDVVLLPFSIESYGIMPQFLSYRGLSSVQQKPNSAIELGFQPQLLNPKELNLGRPNGVCSNGKDVYIAASQSVYLFREGKIQLYAGSPNSSNRDELSHRLRVAFGRFASSVDINIACGPDHLLVLDTENLRLLRITDAGPVQVLLSGPMSDGSIPFAYYGFLVEMPNGDIVITDSTNNQIFKLTKAGQFSRVAGTGVAGYSGDGGTARDAMVSEPAGVAALKDGSFIFADNNNHRVRKVTPQGVISTFAGNGASGFGEGPQLTTRLGSPKGLAIGPDEAVYVTSLESRRIFKIAAGNTSIFAGGGPVGSYQDGFPAKESQLDNLWTLTVDRTNIVYFVDRFRDRVRKVDGGIVSSVAGTSFSSEPVPSIVDADKATISSASSVVIAPNGTIYFSERSTSTIRKLDPQTKKISIFAGLPTVRSPGGLALASDGSLYVADSLYGRITKLDPSGASVQTFPLKGHQPDILALGPNGTVYFVSLAYCVGRLETSGDVTPLFNCEAGVEKQVIRSILGLAVAPDGGVFVTEPADAQVHYYDPATATTRVIAGKGTSGFSGDAGPARLAELNFPTALWLEADGRVLVADTLNSRIRELKPAVNASGSSYYEISTKFGNVVSKDCSGNIVRQVDGRDLEREFQSSLGVFCYARPIAIATQNSCSPSGGVETYVFSQSGLSNPSIGNLNRTPANIARIQRPCSR